MCELKLHRDAKLGELLKSMQQTVDRRNPEKVIQAKRKKLKINVDTS